MEVLATMEEENEELKSQLLAWQIEVRFIDFTIRQKKTKILSQLLSYA